MRRELYLVRRFFHGSVEPYFGDATFVVLPSRKLPVIWRQVGLQDVQAGTLARMAALLTKMFRCVERFMQYADDGDGFRRLLIENYVRDDWNRIETDNKFVSLATQLGMYA